MTIYRVRWGRLRPASASCVKVFYPSEADACFAQACFPVANPPDWAVVESHAPGAQDWIPVRAWSLSANHNGARQS